TLVRLLHQRGERVGRLREGRRALAELGDRALEVVELLLALDGALEETALFGCHLVEQLVRLFVADAARGDARPEPKRRADLRLLEERVRGGPRVVQVGARVDRERQQDEEADQRRVDGREDREDDRVADALESLLPQKEERAVAELRVDREELGVRVG